MTGAPADAASPAPSKVDVRGAESDWNITVDYTDGSMRTVAAMVGPMGTDIVELTVSTLDPVNGPTSATVSHLPGEPVDLPANIAPGVVVGAYRPEAGGSDAYSYLVGRMYATSTDCIGGQAGSVCITAGLKAKPATQAATVAAVPTTGAPSSDLVLPAALLAAGMVGGGLLIRKKKDRTRA